MDFIQMKKFCDLRRTDNLKRRQCSTHNSDSVTFIRNIIRDETANHTLVCCNVVGAE
jgi:ethanolamine utilization cobalamin adenosyltransferase